jgi:hypothetical protein
LAAQEAVSKAPSQKLIEMEHTAPDITSTISELSFPDIRESKLVQMAKVTGRKEKHGRLDLAVVQLFCVAGLPTNLAAWQEWKNLLAITDPSYRPASRDTLEYEHIPGEQEHVKEVQIAYLKTQDDLTISFDGGTSRGKQSFWTVHVTTAARQVYFVEGREATSVSHTAVWIKGLVMEVCCRWSSSHDLVNNSFQSRQFVK